MMGEVDGGLFSALMINIYNYFHAEQGRQDTLKYI
jgi:hypothetical protein